MPFTSNLTVDLIILVLPLLQDGSDVSVEADAGDLASASTSAAEEDGVKTAGPTITAQPWCGRYAVPSAEFTAATVGAKSLNTLRLQASLVPNSHNFTKPASNLYPFHTPTFYLILGPACK